MANWSSDWLPAARSSLDALRGSNGNDASGNPVPALSVVDATTVLSTLVKSVLVQLDRLREPGWGAAGRTDLLGAGPALGGNAGDGTVLWPNGRLAEECTITAVVYLAAAPPPPGATQTSAWYRSPTDYTMWGQLGTLMGETDTAAAEAAAWAIAFSGQDPGGAPDSISGLRGEVPAGVAIYAPYTYNGYDDTSGQLAEVRQLVGFYQQCCDAIASGAVTQGDQLQPMSQDACLAFWDALGRVGASLDTLADVPPRPPTSQVLQDAIDEAAKQIGNAVATAANVAGKVVGEAAKGVFSGLGVYGAAFVIGVLAIWFAVR